MENTAQVTLELVPGQWNEDAARLIPLAHQAASVDSVRHQVDSGRAQIFYVKAEAVTVGAFVLRVDQTGQGAEGVIVSGAGELPGVDLVAACMPGIESLFVGVDAIRYHTARPALARRLARMGYTATEIVCRKEIEHAPIH